MSTLLRGMALALLLSTPAQAATIVVDTTAQDLNANGTACSLRAAIIAANRGAARAGCAAGSAGVVNTIRLQAGATYTLTEPDPIEGGMSDRASWYGANGLPPIKSRIVIEGR